MRWILVATAVSGFLIAIATHSPGWMALGVLLGLGCGIGAALAFVDLHIRATSRSEYMTPGELDALKAAMKPPAPAEHSSRLPPPTPG